MEPPVLCRTLEQDDSIRLLTLLPGLPDEKIRCSLIYTRLDSVLPFEAISYAWGDSNDRVDIELSGKIFATTRSLCDALHQFRRREESRLLWADAICINQDDFLERSQQVQIMSKIYSSAWRTLIWLGSVLSNTELSLPIRLHLDDLTFRVLNKTRHFPKSKWFAMMAVKPSEGGKLCIRWQQQVLDDGDFVGLNVGDLHEAVNNLFSRGWFQRMWVLQELAVSKTPVLCCGRWCAPWDSLFNSMIVFGTSDDILWSVAGLDAARAKYQEYGFVSSSLMTLLSFEFFATDPKDKILGVLGMARWSKPLNSTMTVEELYVSAIWSCFSEFDTCYPSPFVALAKVSERRNTKFSARLPSWKPDLSIPSGPNPPEFSWRSLTMYRAGGQAYQFQRNSLMAKL